MSLWTIELIRTEIGPKSWLLPGRREEWLWRAYEGSDDYSIEALQEMYDRSDYLLGVTAGRIASRSDALAEAKAACEAYDRKRGLEVREIVGYDTGAI